MKRLLLELSLLLALVGLATPAQAGYDAATGTIDLRTVRGIAITGPVGAGATAIADRIADGAKPGEEFWVLINSPGGSIPAGTIILGAMHMARARGAIIQCFVPVAAASMAFQLLTECDNRFVLASTKLLFHQPAVSTEQPITPELAAYLLVLLRTFEANLLPALGQMMGVDVASPWFKMHYQHETLWEAKDLDRATPGWLTIINNVIGLPKLFSLPLSGGGEGEMDKKLQELIEIDTWMKAGGPQ